MVAQFVRQQQSRNRLGQPGDVLGNINQRHGQIARRIQNGKSECADQHHVAGAGAPALPKRDRPRQQRDNQRHRDGRMGEP